MTILTEGYLYRCDKWENVTRENKKWEGQNTTIYYEPGADTQANRDHSKLTCASHFALQ